MISELDEGADHYILTPPVVESIEVTTDDIWAGA
jgi:hypothetical protein